jgi:SAM-dependent methyltransferase
VVQRLVSAADTVTANRRWWDADAEDYLAAHGDFLGLADFVWCPEGLRESDAGLLGELAGRRVLEVGLGYGTVAEALARGGADYHGLDIAAGPVEMARHRLAGVPGGRPDQVQQGSVLDLPFPDASFDRVVSIGCLHHTGDLGRAVAEVRRVLRPGGELLLMVYNRHSARRVLLWPLLAARHRLVAGAPTPEEWLRHANDGTAAGEAAPHTDFVTVAELRGLLHGMRDVRIDRRSIDRVPLGPLEISRARLMRLGLDRLVGLDLYATGRA